MWASNQFLLFRAGISISINLKGIYVSVFTSFDCCPENVEQLSTLYIDLAQWLYEQNTEIARKRCVFV